MELVFSLVLKDITLIMVNVNNVRSIIVMFVVNTEIDVSNVLEISNYLTDNVLNNVMI